MSARFDCRFNLAIMAKILLSNASSGPVIFFLSVFSFMNIGDSQENIKGERISLASIYHLHLIHRHLDIKWLQRDWNP